MPETAGRQRRNFDTTDKKLPSIPVTGDSSNHLQPRAYHPVSIASSSVYSQQSPEMRQGPRLDIPRSSSIYPDDISPPDSPRTTGGRSSSPNVSPISTAGSGFRSKGLGLSSHPPSSGIPVASQHQQAQSSTSSVANISGWRERIGASNAFGNRRTKWDTYSGEPTTNDKGKHGSSNPGSTPFDRPSGMGTTSTVSSPPPPEKPSLWSSTLKKVGKKESAPSQPREEWKGASGRQPIMSPPADKPNPGGKNKSFPTPSQRRKQQGLRQGSGLRHQRESSGQGSDTGQPTSTSKSRPLVAPEPKKPIKYLYEQPEEQNSKGSIVSPYPPRLDSHINVSGDDYGSSTLSHLQTQVSPTYSKIIREEAIVQTPEQVEAPSRLGSHESPKFTASQLRNAVQNMDLSNEPASRFSATTYNTSVPDSPPGTPDLTKEDIPPVPTPPSMSIMSRRRPVPTAGVSFGSKPPSRKPTPSDGGPPPETGVKDLPSPPVASEPVDRVVLLEAKLTSLQKKKNNNDTVIYELTNVVQPSSISYDLASRQEIKRTVDALSTENAAITKEIHETGMKLHRALKKRDEASYEPTGLWVRRVTE